jgi:hypothetical protein
MNEMAARAVYLYAFSAGPSRGGGLTRLMAHLQGCRFLGLTRFSLQKPASVQLFSIRRKRF